jgi:hypothetical protein
MVAYEHAVSFLFDQSLIQPIKAPKVATAGDVMPGGGAYPGIPFPIFTDDGRGAMRPSAGDVASYLGEANHAPPTFGSVWFVPFTLFSGDIGAPNPLGDPVPENWVDDGGIAQPAFIYAMSEQKYIDDLAFLLSAAPVGAALNPANSTLGLWLGVDLPGLLNVTALLNGIGIADVSAGPQWAGPEVLRYDSVANPGALLGVNVDNLGTKVAEVKHPVAPVSGYTPIVPQGGGFVGIGAVPIGPVLTGQSFYVNCWMLDLASPSGGFGPFKIVDLSNIIRIQL